MITKALAVAALLLAAPASAYAGDVALEFDNAVLDTPGTPDSVVVDPSGPPIRATAALDEATGAFTVAPATFDFPEYSFSSPVPGTVDVILNTPATGQFDLATGQVTLSANFQAQISISGFGDCNIDTGPVVLSTENAEPLQGRRFPAGVPGFVTGDGAVTVSWPSLPPGTGSGCSLIEPFVNGPGGFWMSRGISPTPEEQPQYDVANLAVSVKPARRKVKSGRKATLRAVVRNTGDATAGNVRLCVNPPKAKRKCIGVGNLAGGKAARAKFRITAPKVFNKKRTFKVRFKAKGDGVTPGKATARLIVKPKGKKGRS